MISIAVGNAFGYEHTVTRGIISALHRTVQVSDEQKYHHLIQTDASINPAAIDVPADGIDQNCDSVPDEEASCPIGGTPHSNLTWDDYPSACMNCHDGGEGGARANEKLAGSRARDGDVAIGPGAGTYDRGIPDAALELAEGAACRCRGCQFAVRIECDGADRAV